MTNWKPPKNAAMRTACFIVSPLEPQAKPSVTAKQSMARATAIPKMKTNDMGSLRAGYYTRKGPSEAGMAPRIVL